MADIAITPSGTTRGGVPIALAILVLLGLTLAVAESLRIERTDLLASTDSGILVVTESGQKVLVAR
jgi:hypothetical protein